MLLITNGKYENIIILLDVYGKSAIAEIYLNSLPEAILDKSLAESNLKANYNLNAMIIKRKNRVIKVSNDTIIQKNDVIVAFGEQQAIKDLFSNVKNDNSELVNVTKENVIDIIDNYGNQAMANIIVNKIPVELIDKPLSESDFKDKYQISILTITRNDMSFEVNKNSVILEHDNIFFGTI